MLSGASVMDGAILVIAADESVPQPQTREHVAALQVIGVKNIVAVQNKIDLVSRDKAIENYKSVRKYLAETLGENIPIIPVSAQHLVNFDLLLEAAEKYLPTPRRNASKPPYMHVVRSFDINKPGTEIEDLEGGVLGGTVVEGKLELGDEIEISPGVKKPAKSDYETLQTKVDSLYAGDKSVRQVGCGGLVGVGSKLDPALTRADGLIGNIVGKPNQLPDSRKKLSIEGMLFDHAIGTLELVKVEPIKQGEVLVVNLGTSVTTGMVTTIRRDYFEVDLKKPVCTKTDSRVAISRKMVGKWRLIGYGTLKN